MNVNKSVVFLTIMYNYGPFFCKFLTISIKKKTIFDDFLNICLFNDISNERASFSDIYK